MRESTLSIPLRETRWNWILNRQSDLIWYIGSALAGWCYILLILGLGGNLGDPIHDPFIVLRLGSHSVALTLELAVFASWAYIVDSPHLWATLARTYLDPDEWLQRSRVLILSLVWFVAGPTAVLAPYLAGALVPMTKGTMAFGGELFFMMFRLWAYYHVVRQHWGFLTLYKRKNDDLLNPLENRADFWFFNLSLYLPLLVFISSPLSPGGFVDVELPGRWIQANPILRPFHTWILILYGMVVLGYLIYQLSCWYRGIPRNGPKLLFLLSIVPLHFAVFSSSLLSLFAVPIVTVGHNLQYHRIVWMYGRNKYTPDPAGHYRWTRPIFRHLWLYLVLGVIFTYGLSRGPWIDFLGERSAFYFDHWIFPGIGMMAGITDPETAGVGAEVVALFLIGWSMQHYYLDSKIWRLSKDPGVAKSLDV